MTRTELLIGQVMRAGLFLSIFLVLIGGVTYLIQHGGDTINYAVFHGEPMALTSPLGIWQQFFDLSPRGIIQFGILILVMTQILRVALTAVYFIEMRDVIFTVISSAIFVVLIVSFFWRD